MRAIYLLFVVACILLFLQKNEINNRLECDPHKTVHNIELVVSMIGTLGYEPAGLTVHSPRMIEGGFIFFVWVSNATQIFS